MLRILSAPKWLSVDTAQSNVCKSPLAGEAHPRDRTNNIREPFSTLRLCLGNFHLSRHARVTLLTSSSSADREFLRYLGMYLLERRLTQSRLTRHLRRRHDGGRGKDTARGGSRQGNRQDGGARRYDAACRTRKAPARSVAGGSVYAEDVVSDRRVPITASETYEEMGVAREDEVSHTPEAMCRTACSDVSRSTNVRDENQMASFPIMDRTPNHADAMSFLLASTLGNKLSQSE